MSEQPDNVLQFRAPRMTPKEHRQIREYYFGGCGRGQSFWPKRHRWGPWQSWRTKEGARYKDRMCLTCSLCSDPVWLDDDAP